jgi:hypothetical protein
MGRTAIATDDFTGDGPALGANWANLNTNWVTVSKTGGIVYGAQTGSPTGSTEGAARWVGAGTFTDDHYSSIVLTNLTNNGTDYVMGVCVRATAGTDSTRDYFLAFVVHSGGGPTYTTKLAKIVNGSYTEIHSASVTWTATDRLELEVSGASGSIVLTVCKNGTALGGSFSQTGLTEAALTSGGAPGVIATGTSAIQGDDWEGGSYTADSGDPEGSLACGKLIGGGLLIKGVLVP